MLRARGAALGTDKALVRSSWIMWGVLEMKQLSRTVLLIHRAMIITPKMQAQDVKVDISRKIVFSKRIFQLLYSSEDKQTRVTTSLKYECFPSQQTPYFLRTFINFKQTLCVCWAAFSFCNLSKILTTVSSPKKQEHTHTHTHTHTNKQRKTKQTTDREWMDAVRAMSLR